MIAFGTATLVEILWTGAAVPGLVLWAWNRVVAGRSMAAVRRLGLTNGRQLWARFSVLLTTVFLLVESTFITVGVIAMLRQSASNGTGTAVTSLILALLLIAASGLITYLAFRWRAVDVELLAVARERHRKH